MKIRSHAQWHQLFQEQATSGQDETAFCAAHGIARPYFRQRRRELSGDGSGKGLSAFVPVAVARSSEPAAVDLRFGPVALRLPASVSVRWLADLLHALKD